MDKEEIEEILVAAMEQFPEDGFVIIRSRYNGARKKTLIQYVSNLEDEDARLVLTEALVVTGRKKN